MSGTEGVGCRAKVHESPAYGRVLEVVLAGPQPTDIWTDFWKHVRERLEQEVDRQRPQFLVIDLRALDSVYGVVLVAAPVAGSLAMQKLGIERRTRILATGETASRLPTIIRAYRLVPLLGGRVYSDLGSALGDPSGVQDEPTA